jgi:hypothetical protein
MTTITIIVTPILRLPGRFATKLASNGDVLVKSSRTPFLDSARRLLERGYPADATLIMKHENSLTESLRATIGSAAALIVKETDYGPAFRRYDGPLCLSAAPPTAPDASPQGDQPPTHDGGLSKPAGHLDVDHDDSAKDAAPAPESRSMRRPRRP